MKAEKDEFEIIWDEYLDHKKQKNHKDKLANDPNIKITIIDSNLTTDELKEQLAKDFNNNYKTWHSKNPTKTVYDFIDERIENYKQHNPFNSLNDKDLEEITNLENNTNQNNNIKSKNDVFSNLPYNEQDIKNINQNFKYLDEKDNENNVNDNDEFNINTFKNISNKIIEDKTKNKNILKPEEKDAEEAINYLNNALEENELESDSKFITVQNPRIVVPNSTTNYAIPVEGDYGTLYGNNYQQNTKEDKIFNIEKIYNKNNNILKELNKKKNDEEYANADNELCNILNIDPKEQAKEHCAPKQTFPAIFTVNEKKSADEFIENERHGDFLPNQKEEKYNVKEIDELEEDFKVNEILQKNKNRLDWLEQIEEEEKKGYNYGSYEKTINQINKNTENAKNLINILGQQNDINSNKNYYGGANYKPKYGGELKLNYDYSKPYLQKITSRNLYPNNVSSNYRFNYNFSKNIYKPKYGGELKLNYDYSKPYLQKITSRQFLPPINYKRNYITNEPLYGGYRANNYRNIINFPRKKLYGKYMINGINHNYYNYGKY